MKNTTNARINYIDIAKGLGMLSVIWGHVMLSGFTNQLVYAVHMPLFFFLSGMVYKKVKYTSLLSLVKSRVKNLLLPYVIFSVLTWILWATYNYIFGLEVKSYISPLLQTVIAQGSGNYFLHNGPLWFVSCLFVTEILYYFIAKTKPVINVLICILFAIIGHFMIYNNSVNFDFTELPWNIESAMNAMLFYSMGNLFAGKLGLDFLPNFTATKKMAAWFIAITTTLVLCVGSYFNGIVTIGSNRLGNNTIAFYFIAFCGIIATLMVSVALEKYHINIVNIIKWIGRNSFYFMAIHVPAVGFISAIISKLLRVSTDVMDHSLLYSTITFIITLIACSIVVFVINQFIGMVKARSMRTFGKAI